MTVPSASTSLDIARASLSRCLSKPEFLTRFYDHFMKSSPEIAERFKNTDFKKQKFVLGASLKTMLLYARGGAVQESEAMKKLASRHSRNDLNIPARFYDIWLECLLTAVRETDPETSPTIIESWREVMLKGIGYLKSKY